MIKPSFSFKYNGTRIDSQQVKDVYEVDKGVNVRVSTKEYKDFDAIEWMLSFENTSGKDSGIFSEILDCDTCLSLTHPKTPNPGFMPKDGDACIITMNGIIKCENYWENDRNSSVEFSFHHEYLDKCENRIKKFENFKGLSSNEIMPFFDVTSNGDGYFTAIGWSGSWKSEFQKCDDGITMKTGLARAEFYLKPGETLRTAAILVMKYTKDEDKHNKIRRLMKKYYSHKSNFSEKPDGLTSMMLWGGLPSEEMKKRVGEIAAHGIKIERMWIDAAWYGNCQKCEEEFSGDWGEHTGDWNPNPKVHPGGLLDVVSCIEDGGMKLLLWIEPERAIEGTKVTKEHPDWFIKIPGDTSNMLWYGNEEAFEYTCEMLSERIEKYKIGCFRQDFNVRLEDYCLDFDEENRTGIIEIKHVMGMYRLWDFLLSKYPHLMIDNCCGGGRRIDIETLKRSIPLFRTDYQCSFNVNPEVSQTHNANISAYFPYNGCAYRTKRDDYGARSTYSSSWCASFYSTIFQEMSEEDFAWMKKSVDEYTRIRKYFSKDFYNHGSVVLDNTSWAVWQYHDAERQSGIVMAFRRERSPFKEMEVTLRGLVNGKTYEVENIDTKEVFEISDTLDIVLPEMRSSVIFEYKMK